MKSIMGIIVIIGIIIFLFLFAIGIHLKNCIGIPMSKTMVKEQDELITKLIMERKIESYQSPTFCEFPDWEYNIGKSLHLVD